MADNMYSDSRLKKGDRVHLSEQGQAERLGPWGQKDGIGTIVGFSYPYGYRLRWDGQTSTQSYHHSLIERLTTVETET